MECPDVQHDDDNELDIAKIVEEINSGQCEITAMIIPIKEFLTSKDAEKRAHGMSTISKILKLVDPKICNQSQGMVQFIQLSGRIFYSKAWRQKLCH
ncbi:hypothetical protein BLA29_001386 [Euroglyphus maynei]|uniref:Uncharacterized protein n=1 Tax=Euroglyphus maynei TaxID=6958 RepID=A0A1Y3AS28_EURMA|nr:hypothetical protein BLA29_001386 [Euroglyphus maynei]